MAVVSRFAVPRDTLSEDVHQENQMLKVKEALVEEDEFPPATLSV